MNANKNIQPILITGAKRSGSTFIARILSMCGAFGGTCNNMYENTAIHSLHYEMLQPESIIPKTDDIRIPFNWVELIELELEQEGWDKQTKYFVKNSLLALYWPVWDYAFPDAKWIIVRRRTGDVIQSCLKTGYLKTFKNPEVLKTLNVDNEKEAWLWKIRQYEQKFVEMIQAGLNCRIIWPDRMADGNFLQIIETVDWLGLKWNKKIPSVIYPLIENRD